MNMKEYQCQQIHSWKPKLPWYQNHESTQTKWQITNNLFNESSYKNLQCNTKEKNAANPQKDYTSWSVGFISRIQWWFDISKAIYVIHHLNKNKDKCIMIISIDAKFDKIYHKFIMKTLKEEG